MEPDKSDTRSKIISVAVDMIGRHSDLSITTREIARKAGVNLAAINYYFGSKDNLFDEVEKYFNKTIKRIYDELLNSDLNPRERVIMWAQKTMEQLIEFPGILFLLATKLIKDRGMHPGIGDMIKNSETSLAPIVKELTRSDDDELISFKIIRLLSGVIAPVLFYHGANKTMPKVNISNEKVRKSYIEELVNSII